MAAKKKLIRVKKFRTDKGDGYGFSKAQFAWMCPPIDGVRTQITPFVYCRERVTGYVHAAMNNLDYNEFDSDREPFDRETLRILIAKDPQNFEQFRTKLFNGKAIMNIYEDIAGWERSKITTVKHEVRNNVWLLTGPKEWLMAPQLVSAFTFILRLTAEYGPFDVDGGLDSVEDEFERLCKKWRGRDGHYDVTGYLEKFKDKLYVLVKYHKELFGKDGAKKLWPRNESSGNVGVRGGFLYLSPEYNVDGSFCYGRWKRKFAKLCKQHLPRKKK